MNLVLIRHAYLPQATLGTLIAGPLRLATLEEPWRPDPDGPGGQRREGVLTESCVEDGQYQLVPHDGAKQRDVWALLNPSKGVYRNPGDIPLNQSWGRSSILIHSGNSTSDIEGCICVGARHGFEGGKPWLYDSMVSLGRLRALLGRDTHLLTIRPTTGTAELAA